jgi:hypothetical protein
LDVVNWVHRFVAVTAGVLRVRLPGFRARLRTALDDLDREIQKAHLATDSSRTHLDVEALASTEEIRFIIGLQLDGWTWHEINERLRKR